MTKSQRFVIQLSEMSNFTFHAMDNGYYINCISIFSFRWKTFFKFDH